MSIDSNPGSSLVKFDGFILTRQWVESPSGIELIFWMASEQGPCRFRLSGQQAVCFFPTSQQARVEDILVRQSGWRIAATQLKNFDSEPISALYLKSQRKLFEIRDRLGVNDVRLTEADIKPTDRFLMERFITAAVSIEAE